MTQIRTELRHTANAKDLHFFVCLFLTFFQLCYCVLDKALSHLHFFKKFSTFGHVCKDFSIHPFFAKKEKGLLHYLCCLFMEPQSIQIMIVFRLIRSILP